MLGELADRIRAAYDVAKELPQPYGAIAFEWLLNRDNGDPRPASCQTSEANCGENSPSGAAEAIGDQDEVSADDEAPAIDWDTLAHHSALSREELEPAYAISDGALRVAQRIPAERTQYTEKTPWVACLLLYGYTYGLGEQWVPGEKIRRELERRPNALDKKNWCNKHMGRSELFSSRKTGTRNDPPFFRLTPKGEAKAVEYLRAIAGLSTKPSEDAKI